MTFRLAIVGYGKIARDQHVPAIGRNPGITLAGVASPDGGIEGLPHYASLAELLASSTKIDAVSICTPPHGRHEIARTALEAGLHVLMEKPPGATVGEVTPLVGIAAKAGRSLFATWHSRFAPAVEPARAFLADRRIDRVEIAWKEDVRKWHPGQQWIWEPGGLGVFDPGINALSIITAVMPRPIFLTASELTFPSNRAAPIAARLSFSDAFATPIEVAFDWRQLGPQIWHMHFDTDAGRLTLDGGGKLLSHDGRVLVDDKDREYDAIYREFLQLVGTGASDVDLQPMILTADAFLLARHASTDAFEDDPR